MGFVFSVMKRKASTTQVRKNSSKKKRFYDPDVQVTKKGKVLDELKVHENVTTGTVGANASSVMITLSDMGVGTGYNQRIANKIQMSSIHVKCEFLVADNTNAIHWRIFRWNNKGTPTWSDVVSNPAYSWISFVNFNNLDKVHTIKTGTIDMVTGNDSEYVYLEVFANLGLKAARWEASGGAKDSGQLYLLLTSDSAAVTHPGYTCARRLRYYG